jgi:hypothetical protein
LSGLSGVCSWGRQDGYPESSRPVLNDLTCAFALAHDLAHLLATQSPDKPGDDHLRLGLRRLGDSVSQLLRLLSREEHLLGVLGFSASAGGSPGRGKVARRLGHQSMGVARAM